MTGGREPATVSLNGVDNVGKTSQLRWLHRALPGAQLVGSIDRWHPRWRDVAGDFARWWFEKSSTEEHVDLVMRSHIARRQASHPLALEDRGLPMLQATCAATAAVKDGLTVRQAMDTVERLLAGLPVTAQRREVHVFLRRSKEPAEDAALSLAREPAVDERYVAYQHALAEVLALQAARGTYDLVLTLADLPILDVQRILRAQLAQLEIPVEVLPDAAVDRIWVLGGMSESGKSTVGELLRDEHGVTRLKIGYLLEVAAARAGVVDLYRRWSEEEQAERLTEELLRFAAATKARTVSVESARRFDSTAHLKRVLGERCQIVFLHAGLDHRAGRAAEPLRSLQARDAEKADSGAHRITEIADHVVDNSGPLSALKLTVSRIVADVDVPRAEPEPDPLASSGPWLWKATAHLVDDQVALVLATGSTGSADWRAGWSDLDLLVVRDELPAEWLRSNVATLRAPDGVKLGISAFTTGDLAGLRMPPRVIQSLRRAALGTGLLYRRPGYEIPVPAAAVGDRASRRDLGVVLMTTRRLLAAEHVDVRALHKHLVLIAKVLLRADGHHLHAADDVLAAFKDLHPSAGVDPPALDDLISCPTDPSVQDRLMRAVDRILTYLDRLDHTARSHS